MIRKLLSVSLIVISLAVSSVYADQKMYNVGDLSINGTTFVEVNTGQLANGIARIFYPSGRVEHELSYRNGKRDGISKHFEESGRLKSYYTYKNGQRNGTATVYTKVGYTVAEYINDMAMRGTIYSLDGSRSSPMTQEQLDILSRS